MKVGHRRSPARWRARSWHEAAATRRSVPVGLTSPRDVHAELDRRELPVRAHPDRRHPLSPQTIAGLCAACHPPGYGRQDASPGPRQPRGRRCFPRDSPGDGTDEGRIVAPACEVVRQDRSTSVQPVMSLHLGRLHRARRGAHVRAPRARECPLPHRRRVEGDEVFRPASFAGLEIVLSKLWAAVEELRLEGE
jgi:hypothetical protein